MGRGGGLVMVMVQVAWDLAVEVGVGLCLGRVLEIRFG
jgi:hypothetical protein